MLPLWRDQVLVTLTPTHLSMVRLRGWHGVRKVMAQHSQALTFKVGQTSWQPAIDVLNICLKDSVWQNANLRVVIANTLVRYAMLPWSEEVLNADEEFKYVKFKMDEIFGVDDKKWEISLGANHYGSPRLACATDYELLSQIRQLALKNNLKLKSIQPHLVASLNYLRRELKDNQLHFLLSDGEKLITTYIKQGYLQSLRVDQIHGVLSDQIVKLSLRREKLMSHESDGVNQVYLFASAQTKLSENIGQALKLKHLSLPVNYISHPAAFQAAIHII